VANPGCRFAPGTQAWWTQALKNWTTHGVTFDGIWLDMNEASSFCEGSWYAARAPCDLCADGAQWLGRER
jgi:alpha-glucosidase (family GH31 glycosyl hydrolase)